MRMPLHALTASLLLAVPAIAQDKPAQAPATQAPTAHVPATEQILHRDQVQKSRPTRDLKVIRSWDLENSKEINVRLHEIVGTVPLHVHADADERIFLLEGSVKMTLGDREELLKPGDYVSIPRGVKHKVELAPGTKRALAAGFTIPAPDPKQTTWLEPPPAPAAPK